MADTMLYKKVSAYLREREMLKSGDRVLAAVSGGADSMCMLHLLHQLSRQQGFSLFCATFDHQIRAEGASDVTFVARWCKNQGIPYYTGCGNVPQYAQRHRLGLEESARHLRYGFLRETAAALGCTRIATAHNANDNAETVLFHLLRGSGLNGLGGISPVQQEVIRPLLCCTRQEIEDYLTRLDIPHVEDATNRDTAYSRNYLRHEVLPLLTAKNPGLVEGLLRTCEGLRKDEAYLSRQAEQAAEQAIFSSEQVSVSVEHCKALPDALFNRVMQRWVEHLSPETVLSSRQRQALRELCVSAHPSASCDLPCGLVARREYDLLLLECRGQPSPTDSVLLSPGETVCFGGRVFSCSLVSCPAGKFNQPHEFYLTPPPTPLLLRQRRTGDAITLPARSRKTVKKLLIDSKLPREERSRIAVLEAGGKLAALDGFGADIAFLPKSNDPCWKITSSEPIPNNQKQ